jgi:hypothetical protein
MRYSSSALSGPAPAPPALLHASSARPGRANLPRQRLTSHASAWPAAAQFSLHWSEAAFAPPESITVCGHLPLTSARYSGSPHEQPDPRPSKQGLQACPTLSLPARACAGTQLMIPAPPYPGPLPSSTRSSRSSTVRSSSRAPAPPTPQSFY